MVFVCSDCYVLIYIDKQCVRARALLIYVSGNTTVIPKRALRTHFHKLKQRQVKHYLYSKYNFKSIRNEYPLYRGFAVQTYQRDFNHCNKRNLIEDVNRFN